MNKKLITLAVAAAMAAPAAAMAEATLYGKLHVSIDYVDVDRVATWGSVPRTAGGPSIVLGSDTYINALATGFAGGKPAAINPNVRSQNGPAAAAVDNFYSPAGTVLGAVEDPALNQLGPVVYAPNTMMDVYSVDANGDIVQTYDNVSGANVYNTVYSSEYYKAIRNGYTPEVSRVMAIRQASVMTESLASADQLQAAYANAVLFGQGQKFKGWTLDGNARSSRIGVKGSEDLGNGIKAIYQVEFNVDIANENRDTFIANGNRGDGISMRNSFVGLAGNFGTFLIGRHDTPLKISTGKLDLFADTLADYNHTIGFHDVRADNAIAYISPSFSGFSVAAALIPSGGASPLGDYNNSNDSIGSAWSLAAIYNNGPFYASVAYENLTSDHWMGASDPFSGTVYEGFNTEDVYKGLYGEGAKDDTKWRVGLGLLDWNGFTLTGIYESRTNVFGAPSRADQTLWQIQAGYAFGNNMIKGMYGQADVEKCADPFGYGYRFTCGPYGLDVIDNKDISTWAIAFDHNFSKRTKAYALYTALDSDAKSGDWSGFSLGMIHSF
jgi:predicted porin